MMCYRDMTFCRAEDCKHFAPNTCGRAYNAEVKQGAFEWMGERAPVAFYTTPPERCYEPIDGVES